MKDLADFSDEEFEELLRRKERDGKNMSRVFQVMIAQLMPLYAKRKKPELTYGKKETVSDQVRKILVDAYEKNRETTGESLANFCNHKISFVVGLSDDPTYAADVFRAQIEDDIFTQKKGKSYAGENPFDLRVSDFALPGQFQKWVDKRKSSKNNLKKGRK